MTVEEVKAKIAIHICFGNQAGRARDPRSYAPFLKYMGDLKAEQFVLEFAKGSARTLLSQRLAKRNDHARSRDQKISPTAGTLA